MYTLKQCTCGNSVTDIDAVNLTSDPLGVWFTCARCSSTLFLRGKRLAKCFQGGNKYHKCHSTVSNEKLPFFKAQPEKPFDEYYCGCYGDD